MKKILCSLFLVLTLCSCATKTESITPVTKGLKFTAQISYYNESYECDVTVKQNGDTEIAFLIPEDLSGLKITYSGNSVTANYNGIEYKFTDDSLPQYSVSDIIYKIFAAKYDTVTQQDDYYYVEYAKDDLNCKIVIGATGLPIKIEEKSSRFEIIIKNATIIN